MTKSKKLIKEEVRLLTHGIPTTRYPRKLEDWYARELGKLVTRWRAIATTYLDQLVKEYVRGGSAFLTDDKKDRHSQDMPSVHSWVDDMNQALKMIDDAIIASQTEQDFTKLATRLVNGIDNFSYLNVKMQTKIAGIDPISRNQAIGDYIKAKIAENAGRIKRLRSEYVDKLQSEIYNSITKGGGISDLTKAITKTGEVTNKHAALIANDQTGTIISQLDSYRSKAAGAQKYIWQSMEDERVRPAHAELDQTEQSYDDPDGGDDGQLPGEPIRCRCVAVPIF